MNGAKKLNYFNSCLLYTREWTQNTVAKRQQEGRQEFSFGRVDITELTHLPGPGSRVRHWLGPELRQRGPRTRQAIFAPKCPLVLCTLSHKINFKIKIISKVIQSYMNFEIIKKIKVKHISVLFFYTMCSKLLTHFFFFKKSKTIVFVKLQNILDMYTKQSYT